jgi:hypothetical protein
MEGASGELLPDWQIVVLHIPLKRGFERILKASISLGCS